MRKKSEKHTACGAYEAVLEDYLEGALDPAAAEVLRNHVEGCEGCREGLEAAREANRLLADSLAPTGQASPHFSMRVIAAIRSELAARSGEAQFWGIFERLAWHFTLAAALAVGGLAFYFIGAGSGRLPVATPPAQQQVQELIPEATQPPADRQDVLLAIAEREHGR